MTIKAEQNKKERKRWEKLSRTKEGKIELEKEIELAQLSNQPFPANTNEEREEIAKLQEVKTQYTQENSKSKEKQKESEEVTPYATNWEDVKDQMTLSLFYKNDEEKKEGEED